MDAGRTLRRVLVVLALLLVTVCLLPGITAGHDGHATVGNGTVDVSADRHSIGTGPLANASGSTELVVRFTPIGEIDADRPDAVVEELDDHAAAEQSAFEAFAEQHEAVTVETEFWLANAMLVTVDAGMIDGEDLLTVTNVTSVHENVEIETVAATSPEATAPETAPRTAPPVDIPSTRAGDVSPPTAAVPQTADPAGEHTPGLELIAAPSAWDRFDTRGAGVTVAVIDTGVDPGHQDIDLAGWARFDENGTLVSNDVTEASDPNGHGTHVAGTVAGGAASGTHIGVAPDADVYGIDTFGAEGTATFAGVLAGMEHATATADVDVLQMSLGATGTFDGFTQPVRNARAADRIVVAASGNTGHETSSSPANVYDSLAVGAVRDDRTVAAFSSGERINKTAAFRSPPPEWPAHYPVPDVAAPGVDVLSAEAGTTDGYVEFQGTSMAAPHVSGIAALAIAATDGRIDGNELQASIVDTTVHPEGASEPDDRYGHGVVDAEAAVESATEAAPPTPTPTPMPTATPETIEPETDDSVPGFGVVAVVAALVLTGLAADGRRR